jgi:ABC-type arginine/histidine transport system permease subunit
LTIVRKSFFCAMVNNMVNTFRYFAPVFEGGIGVS